MARTSVGKMEFRHIFGEKLSIVSLKERIDAPEGYEFQVAEELEAGEWGESYFHLVAVPVGTPRLDVAACYVGEPDIDDIVRRAGGFVWSFDLDDWEDPAPCEYVEEEERDDDSVNPGLLNDGSQWGGVA